jgi:hypothetical protein
VVSLSGPWRGRLDLRGVETIEGLELAFFSPSFVPARDAPPSGDRRRLGVALGGVVLRTLAAEEADALPPRPAWLAHYPHDPAPWVQTGFHRSEVWGLSPASWTDGRATARVELPAPARPRYVLVELADTGPDGAAVELTLDGRVFFAADLAPGAWSGCAAVPDGEPAARLELGLVSSTFVPAERLPGAQDGRRLGVAVRSLCLVF